MENRDHERFMRLAIEQAHMAMRNKDRPIGAVVVHHQEVVGRAANGIYSDRSKIEHAELRVLESCSSYLFDHAHECTLYTTHQPCIMCLGAIAVSNVRRVVYGLADPESPGLDVINQIPYLRDRIDLYIGGILEDDCRELWKEWISTGTRTPQQCPSPTQ